MTSSKILMGIITGPHGLQGGVRFRFYGDSLETLESYKVFYDETGTRTFKVKNISPYKESLVTLFLEGATTRTQAEALKGVPLYVDRESLSSLSEDEYYFHDLEGLKVQDEEGCSLGEVQGVTQYGGDTVLKISCQENPEQTFLVPFRKEFVTSVFKSAGYLVVDRGYAEALRTLEKK